MHQCNICMMEVSRFLPYKGGRAALSEMQNRLDVIGSDVDNFSCPHCGGHDRERHLKMYIEKTGLLGDKSGIRILHFAPEPKIAPWLAMFRPSVYVLADLIPPDGRFERINIEQIPYGDNSFDLVIANHILEHVDSPENALSEVNRVLAPGGYAILQTPFSPVLSRTFADPALNDESQRLFFYGQEDHVRMFGQDIFETINCYLDSHVKMHPHLFSADVAARHGVNEREPFFLYSKRRAPAQNTRNDYADPVHVASRKVEALSGRPEVSICCITYNHESFISDALDSFLSQVTDFDFEIVVANDGSSDQTARILDRYKDKHPDKLRVINRESNIGMNRNFASALKECRGRYIALCEGDDFWTDRTKLQRQHQVLSENPDVVLTYGSAQALTDHGIDLNYVGGSRRDLSPSELVDGASINTLTAMFCNVIDEVPPEIVLGGLGDMFLWSLLGHHGAGKYCAGVLPSSYRIHSGGVHSTRPLVEKILMSMSTNFALYTYYNRVGEDALSQKFLNSSGRDAVWALRTNREQALEALVRMPDVMEKRAGNDVVFNKALLMSLIDQVRQLAVG